jgi:hypothetical protein
MSFESDERLLRPTMRALEMTLRNLMMGSDVNVTLARTDREDVVVVSLPPMFARRLVRVLQDAHPYLKVNVDGSRVPDVYSEE